MPLSTEDESRLLALVRYLESRLLGEATPNPRAYPDPQADDYTLVDPDVLLSSSYPLPPIEVASHTPSQTRAQAQAPAPAPAPAPDLVPSIEGPAVQ